jgi:hypothetical protein
VLLTTTVSPTRISEANSANEPSRQSPAARLTTSIREASRRSSGCCAISSSGSS